MEISLFNIVAETADDELRKLLLEPFQKLPSADRLALRFGHDFEEGVGVDIEVAHLHHIDGQLAKEAAPRFELFGAVVEAREEEHVERYIDAMRERVADRCLDIGERVIAAVVRRIAFVDGADDAHAHGVKPRIDDLLDAFRITGICVDIDLSALRLGANQALGRGDRIRRKRRLALASLSETHDGIGCSRKVVDADLRDFLGRRAERDAALRRRTALSGLQGDTAEAVRIADG